MDNTTQNPGPSHPSGPEAGKSDRPGPFGRVGRGGCLSGAAAFCMLPFFEMTSRFWGRW